MKSAFEKFLSAGVSGACALFALSVGGWLLGMLSGGEMTEIGGVVAWALLTLGIAVSHLVNGWIDRKFGG